MLRKVINCHSYSRLLTSIRPLTNITTSKANEPLAVKKQDLSFQNNFKRLQSSTTNTETINDDHIYTSSFKCAVDDPLKHDTQHINKFYKIDETDLKKIDPFQECLSTEFYKESKAFSEFNLMIRKPAVEIINFLKNIDLSNPAYRFILYGLKDGIGKRSSLMHVTHYCYKDNWLIINIPNSSSILRMAKETGPSFYKEGRVDTPLNASIFLKRFSIQNIKLLKQLDIKTTKEYKWSMRDSSPVGTPLLELIEYANERVKYSSDICGAIIREIKLQSQQEKKNFKVFVSVDSVNSYFGPTRLKRDDKSEVLVDDITLVRNFKKLLRNDWNNAVIVGAIGKLGVIIPGPDRRKKYYDTSISVPNRRRQECTLHYEGPLTPLSLLKREGFYWMEPFVPIEVENYSRLEMQNFYDYYKYKEWIQSDEAQTDDGREELFFLSGGNPAQFNRVCRIV